jgi:nuclear control of ATPase protein 2
MFFFCVVSSINDNRNGFLTYDVTMPSDLVSHFTQSLAASRPVSPSLLPIVKSTTQKPELHSILVSFTQSNPTQTQIANCARSLQDVVSSSLTTASDDHDGQTEEQDEEQVALEDTIVRKLTVAIYSDALDTYLAQAIEVEAEAEWWASIETSRLAVALFFLQSTALHFRLSCLLKIFLFFL